MAGTEELIDQWIDRQAFQEDGEFAEAVVKKFISAFNEVKSSAKFSFDANTFKGLAEGAEMGVKAQSSLNQQLKAVKQTLDARFASEAKLITVETDYHRETLKNNEAIKARNKELRDEAQAELSTIGSRDRAMAQIKVLTGQKDKLNLLNKEEAAQYEALVAKIEVYEDFLKRTGTAAEKQRANIGNYAGSLAPAFQSVIQKIEELRSNLEKGVGIGNATDEASLKATQQIITTLEDNLARASKQGATFAGQAKAIQNAFIGVKAAVDGLSGEGAKQADALVNELRQHAGEAKDALADMKDEIKELASDTRGLDNVTASLNFMAGVTQGAASAYALLGGAEEDVQKTTAQLIAIQGVANSVQQVGQTLTTKGTVVNRAYEFSLKQISTAFDSGAATGTRFRAIMASLGIGAIIVGIGLLVANFDKIKAAVTGASEAQEAYNETVKDYKSAAEDATKKVNEVRAAFDLARTGVITKDEALKKYNGTLGDALGKTTDLNKAEEIVAQKAETYIKVMGLKAQANALFALSAQKAAQGITADLEDQTGVFDKLSAGFKGFFVSQNDGIKSLVESQIEGTKLAKENAKQAADELFKSGEDILKQAGELAKNAGINLDLIDNKEVKDKTVKSAKEISDSTAKARLDAFYANAKLLVQAEADNNNTIYENEKNQMADRLLALSKFYQNRKDLIELQRKYEIASEGLNLQQRLAELEKQKKEEGANIKAISQVQENERLASADRIKVIEQTAVNQRVQIEREGQKAFEKQVEDNLKNIRDKWKADLDEWNRIAAERKQAQQSIFDNQAAQDELNLQLQFEVDAAGASAEKRKKLEEKLQEDIQNLRLKTHLKQLKIDEDELLAQRVIAIIKGKDTSAIDEAITKNHLEQAETRNAITQDEVDKDIAARDKLLDKIQSASAAALDTIQGVLSGNIDRRKNDIQDQIDEVDKLKNAQIEAINAQQLSEEQKAAAIANINTRAQIKKEELEQRQRKLDQQRAKFEREMGIMQIVLQIAIAIAKQQYYAAALAGAALVKALATPVPKFAGGKYPNAGNNYEGPAYTNDNGTGNYIEPIHRAKSNTIELSSERNRLTWLDSNDTVYKSIDDMLNHITRPSGVIPKVSISGDPISMQALSREQAKTNQLLSDIRNKPTLQLGSTERGMQALWQHHAGQYSYTSENTNWTKYPRI